MHQASKQERGRKEKEKMHKPDGNQTEDDVSIRSEGQQQQKSDQDQDDLAKQEREARVQLDSGIALVCISGGADFEIIRGWCDVVTQVLSSLTRLVLALSPAFRDLKKAPLMP